MGATLAEKILARAAGKASVQPGEIVEPSVDIAMSHENGALVINQFLEIYKGTGYDPKVWDPSKIVIILDHRVPAESAKTANNQKKIRDFLCEQGVTNFHEIRGDEGGICHQILPENGYVRPGRIVVGTDSHTTTHGALGSLSWGIGATEMAAVWALGIVPNVEVPPTIKVNLEGELPAHISAKDVILNLIGTIGAKGANFRVMEFHGELVKKLDTSGRLVISNMSVEAGATSGIFPADSETERYLREEAGVTEALDMEVSDPDAKYEKEITLDISNLAPQIACPHMVDNVSNIDKVEGTPVQQIVIGSCTNGRLDDIAAAAKILKGQKVSKSTRMLVFPASGRIYQKAMAAGYLKDLMEAGAVIMNSGCGCCLGVHQGALADGESALSTTNRNFQGRMGNAKAGVYLCSPATAAASAITGVITDPRKGA